MLPLSFPTAAVVSDALSGFSRVEILFDGDPGVDDREDGEDATGVDLGSLLMTRTHPAQEHRYDPIVGAAPRIPKGLELSNGVNLTFGN